MAMTCRMKGEGEIRQRGRTPSIFGIAGQKVKKDSPEDREARILLYQARAEAGVDIFTGKPRNEYASD